MDGSCDGWRGVSTVRCTASGVDERGGGGMVKEVVGSASLSSQELLRECEWVCSSGNVPEWRRME